MFAQTPLPHFVPCTPRCRVSKWMSLTGVAQFDCDNVPIDLSSVSQFSAFIAHLLSSHGHKWMFTFICYTTILFYIVSALKYYRIFVIWQVYVCVADDVGALNRSSCLCEAPAPWRGWKLLPSTVRCSVCHN